MNKVRHIGRHHKQDDDAMISETWQVFQAAKQLLGMPGLQRRFGNRSAGHLRNWMRNPEYSDETQRNPLDWIKGMLIDLDDQGGEDVAIAALTLLAAPLGLRVVSAEPVEPHHDTVEGEFLDAFSAVHLLHVLAKDGAHPNVMRPRVEEAHREIDTFSAHYARVFNEQGPVAARACLADPKWWGRISNNGGGDDGA